MKPMVYENSKRGELYLYALPVGEMYTCMGLDEERVTKA